MEHHIHGVRVHCYFYVYVRHSLHKQRCSCVGVEDQELLLTAMLSLLTVIHLHNICQQAFSECSIRPLLFCERQNIFSSELGCKPACMSFWYLRVLLLFSGHPKFGIVLVRRLEVFL
jgi:hypothetical protein